MPTYENEVTGSGEVAIQGTSALHHAVVGIAGENGTGVMGTSERGDGVAGRSQLSNGVTGSSELASGVRGLSKAGRGVEGMSQMTDGVFGASDSGTGVAGVSRSGVGVSAQSESASAVRAVSRGGRGVEGWSETTYGVSGDSARSAGVRGTSVEGRGVEGWSTRSEGVFGTCESGVGVHGVAGRSRFFTDLGHGASIDVSVEVPEVRPTDDIEPPSPHPMEAFEHSAQAALHSAARTTAMDHRPAMHAHPPAPSPAPSPSGTFRPEVDITDTHGPSLGDFYDDGAGIGVLGEHLRAGIGVKAVSREGFGLAAYSDTQEAIHAETRSTKTASVAAYHLNPRSDTAAIFAWKEGRRGHAGFFVGNVWISGELGVGGDIVLANADCAEDFDVVDAAQAAPGTVMVMGDDGVLAPCASDYDRRVAGVISGAGEFKPGLVLDKRVTARQRRPVALLGKVCVKATASAGAIGVGDMLTTSSLPGHARKADDASRAFGAVIGKALGRLEEGEGLVPILIALQ